jgi:predicted DCC family thiol-disulfide oxidoreductase YuxK
MRRLTVLYDEGCPMCRRFQQWLAGQPLLVPTDFVPAGSAQARALFPGLDHARTLEEVTAVDDSGAIWTNEHAWVICLWVTATHRHLAERLSRPAWLPLARAAAHTAAGIRARTRTTPAGSQPADTIDAGGARHDDHLDDYMDDYIDDCAGTCRPVRQG